MTHEVFTIVAAVRPGAVDRLKDLLKVINENPEANALLPFGKLPMLHFASFVVLHDPVQEMTTNRAGPPGSTRLRKLHRWSVRGIRGCLAARRRRGAAPNLLLLRRLHIPKR